MSNIFFKKSHNDFTWDKLGDIKEGRQQLGEDMPVIIYRVLEYSMNDVLTKEFGVEKANDLFRKAGYKAGWEFAHNALDLSLPFSEFVASLQQTLINLKIGILRIEDFQENGDFVLTIGEDLDCSGLPATNELVCNYDEGFLSSIMESYTGKKYFVREVDCWASGERVCRFKGKINE